MHRKNLARLLMSNLSIFESSACDILSSEVNSRLDSGEALGRVQE